MEENIKYIRDLFRCSLGPAYVLNLYAIHLGQVISTVLGYNDHVGQHGIFAKT